METPERYAERIIREVMWLYKRQQEKVDLWHPLTKGSGSSALTHPRFEALVDDNATEVNSMGTVEDALFRERNELRNERTGLKERLTEIQDRLDVLERVQDTLDVKRPPRIDPHHPGLGEIGIGPGLSPNWEGLWLPRIAAVKGILESHPETVTGLERLVPFGKATVSKIVRYLESIGELEPVDPRHRGMAGMPGKLYKIAGAEVEIPEEPEPEEEPSDGKIPRKIQLLQVIRNHPEGIITREAGEAIGADAPSAIKLLQKLWDEGKVQPDHKPTRGKPTIWKPVGETRTRETVIRPGEGTHEGRKLVPGQKIT